MAIDGQLIRSVARSLRGIEEVGASTLAQARAAGMSGPQSIIGRRLPPVVELARIDDAAFARVADEVLDDLAWIDDGWCSGRSLLVAQRIADASGVPLAGGAGAVSDTVTGAVAIADGPFRPMGGGRWDYHAAAVGWPEGAARPMAIDGLLFSRPVPLETWVERIRAVRESTRLRHPWDLRGLSIDTSLAGGVDRVVDHLGAAVRGVAARGTPIDNRLLRGAPIEGPRSAIEQTARGAWLARRADPFLDPW